MDQLAQDVEKYRQKFQCYVESHNNCDTQQNDTNTQQQTQNVYENNNQPKNVHQPRSIAKYSPPPTVYAHMKQKGCKQPSMEKIESQNIHNKQYDQEYIYVPHATKTNIVNYQKAQMGQTQLLLNNSVNQLWRNNWSKSTQHNDYVEGKKTYEAFDEDKNTYYVNNGQIIRGGKYLQQEQSCLKQPFDVQKGASTVTKDFNKLDDSAHQFAHRDRQKAKLCSYKKTELFITKPEKQESSTKSADVHLQQCQISSEIEKKQFLVLQAESTCRRLFTDDANTGEFVKSLDCKQLEDLIKINDNLLKKVV